MKIAQKFKRIKIEARGIGIFHQLIYDFSDMNNHKWRIGTWNFTDQSGQKVLLKSVSHFLEQAAELGFMSFDTASSYGKGKSEQLLGNFLKRNKRDDFYISGKAVPFSRTSLKKQFQRSLDNLQTSYIDMFYLHWPVPGMNWDEITDFISDLKKKKLIKKAGISNINGDILKILETSGLHSRFDSIQIGYNPLFRPDNLEKDIIPVCRQKFSYQIENYSPLAAGLLAKTAKDLESENLFSGNLHIASSVLAMTEHRMKTKKLILELLNLAKQQGISLPQLIYIWNSCNPLLDSTVAGASRLSHLKELAQIKNNGFSLDSQWIFNEINRLTGPMNKNLNSYDNLFNFSFG